MSLNVKSLTGSELARGLPALARLRMEVFRAWPYLYDGSLAYEQSYLEKFAKAPGAVIVAAEDAGEIVGCATAAPMAAVEPDFAAPFIARGMDVATIFYCGESVLRASYRGKGLGHAFFDARETQARALGGFAKSAFCAVVRPPDHPLAPAGYVPLDAFWRKRGYEKVDGLTCIFTWKDVDQPDETPKTMQFWMKDL